MQFVHDTSVSPVTLWQEFAHDHATVRVLAKRYRLSERTVRTRLDAYALPLPEPLPRHMVAVMDATHAGRSWVIAVRDPNAHENVYFKEASSETTFAYQEAYAALRTKGFSFSAVVVDGRALIPWLFPGLPLQMCHFHQKQIVVRCLTQNPQLPAGIELLTLINTLTMTDEASFTDAFRLWCRTWKEFLNERTVHPETKRWSYTHKRVRQARDSINRHLPYLFTFQRFPDLCIPNTTNSLDGAFAKAKTAVAVHAGLSHERKLKLIRALLQG